MDIGNDTDDPVDYDVDIDVGPGAVLTAEAGGGGEGARPRFLIDPKGTMCFDLSESGTCRHVFEIDLGTQTKTVIALRDAPTTLENVRIKSIEHEGETYYRIDAT